MSPLTPVVVADPQHEPWDDEADVIVVGLGAAGLSAALQARDDGADVFAIDRFLGGGAAALSGGVFYAGGGTHIQQEAGVEDTVDNMLRYLSLEVEDAVSPETLRRFCETSAQNVRWLTDRGVPFYPTLCAIKTSYPTNEYHLYFSGNETFPPYSDEATPIPRGHRTDGGAFPGANLVDPLRHRAENDGVRIAVQSAARRVCVDGSGRVVGLVYSEIPPGPWRWLHARLHRMETAIAKFATKLAGALRRRVDAIAQTHGVERRVRARQGVVLCAGGFVFNRDMVAEHIAEFSPGLPLGTAGDDGLGIRLGQSVGGRVAMMDRASAWRFLYPPNAFAEGILVNGRGERFANEFWYGSKIGEAMVERNDGTATLIIDERLRTLAREQSKPGKLQWFQRGVALANLYFNCTKHTDLPALASAIDVPRDALARTFDDYNQMARGLHPDLFGKDPAGLEPLSEAGPYYAIDCSLGSRRHLCAVMTLGGLAVDERSGQVLGNDGNVVDGLYAAGRTAVGVCSRQYVSGLSLADCVFSGRRAGHAAALIKAQRVEAAPAQTR